MSDDKVPPSLAWINPTAFKAGIEEGARRERERILGMLRDPGDELLDAVWNATGLSLALNKTGAKIAAALESTPQQKTEGER